MDRDTEIRLAARIAEGDLEARNELAESQRELAAEKARRFCRDGEVRKDAEQEAFIGLLRAAELYDGRGPFENFARPWIRQSINRAIRRDSPIPLGRTAYRARLLARRLCGDLGRLDAEELARRTGWQVETARQVLATERDLGQRRDLDERDCPVEDERGLPARMAEVVVGFGRLNFAERLAVAGMYPLDGSEPVREKRLAAMLGVSCLDLQQLTAAALRKLRAAVQD